MFSSKTLFVVGAGASKEAGLPTGTELTDTISKKIDIRFRNFNEQFSGEFEISDALRHHTRVIGQPEEFNSYLNACWHIRDAMPLAISIDNFFDAHQGNEKIELCGKIAIVRSILEAENKSHLFFDPHGDADQPSYAKLQETWYNRFMRALTEGCSKENIAQLFENISFITFNYDRCIEHFLFHSLQTYYGIQPEEAAELMLGVKILHPYGMVGRLPLPNVDGGRPFGANAGGERLLALADQIKTFTERVEDEVALTEIRQVVQEAENIVFLGFAFHPDNMELLRPNHPRSTKHVFATAKGISKNDCGIVESQINDCFKPEHSYIGVELRNDLTCHGLFEEFRRNLTR